MKVFGKNASEYFRIQKPYLVLIVIVGLSRLALSMAGLPASFVKWLSITVLLLVGALYAALRVHRTGFGAYRELFPVIFIQGIIGQAIIVLGISTAILLQQDNIFTGDGGGRTWMHAGSHVIAAVLFSIVLWVLGSLAMLVARTL